jgi:hypothetical protein
MATEQEVRLAVGRWLYRNGYMRLERKDDYVHGADIRVRNQGYGRWFIIEVKGDPIHAKSGDSSRTAAFWVALGQIVTRMNPKSGYYYGIAFPISYRPKLKNLPWQFCLHNRLHVFLVDGNHVEHLDARTLRAMQAADLAEKESRQRAA